jgi:hypothetical protein
MNAITKKQAKQIFDKNKSLLNYSWGVFNSKGSKYYIENGKMIRKDINNKFASSITI